MVSDLSHGVLFKNFFWKGLQPHSCYTFRQQSQFRNSGCILNLMVLIKCFKIWSLLPWWFPLALTEWANRQSCQPFCLQNCLNVWHLWTSFKEAAGFLYSLGWSRLKGKSFYATSEELCMGYRIFLHYTHIHILKSSHRYLAQHFHIKKWKKIMHDFFFRLTR